jgi:hypothetical protein
MDKQKIDDIEAIIPEWDGKSAVMIAAPRLRALVTEIRRLQERVNALENQILACPYCELPVDEKGLE